MNSEVSGECGLGKSGDGNMDSVSSLKSLLKLIEVECVIVNKECANKS